ALQQAQADEQQRRDRARRRVARQQADREGRAAHDEHRHEEGVLAPDEIADPAEHDRPERSHREPGGERGEREDEPRGLVDPGEELRRDDRGEQAVEVEVVPLEHRAERRRRDDLEMRIAQRRVGGGFGHVRRSLPMVALTVPERWRLFNPPRVCLGNGDRRQRRWWRGTPQHPSVMRLRRALPPRATIRQDHTSAVSPRARSASPWTCWPSETDSSATVPSNGAVRACSIFIASSTSRRWPLVTASPAATSTAMTFPGIGAWISPSPCAAAPAAKSGGLNRNALPLR